MLEKTLGVMLVTKLWAILLLEGDFNAVNKMVYGMGMLTLSFPGTCLVHVLAVAIHISPNNGPIEMILSEKLIYYVPSIHFACSIM